MADVCKCSHDRGTHDNANGCRVRDCRCLQYSPDDATKAQIERDRFAWNSYLGRTRR